MRESTKTALAVLAVILLAGAFWLLLLAPKRDQASELGEQANRLRSEVTSEQSRATAAAAAKQGFTTDYQQLVDLGKAVPSEAGTPSLLVQLDGVSAEASTTFKSIDQAGGSGEEVTTEGTENAASLVPLGASTGAAGLLAMPYTLEFHGSFFDIANFIQDLDSLVKTEAGKVDAEGRLVTIDGFNFAPLEEDGESNTKAGDLQANFGVTTYVTPPGQGLTAGASATGPAGVTE